MPGPYTRPQHADPFNDGSVTDETVIIAALSTGLEAVEGTTAGALPNAAQARTNLGLGSAATQASSAFDTAGAATAAQAAAIQRANHTGTQSADTLTDGATNKAFLAAERTKLAGVATGATVNSTDATLLARANHTGTESADVLTDGTTNKAFLATERTKLAGIGTGANVSTVAGRSGAVVLSSADLSDVATLATASQQSTNTTNIATNTAAIASLKIVPSVKVFAYAASAQDLVLCDPSTRVDGPRIDTVGTTSASATVTDTLIAAGDNGKPVSGVGIPANSFVGTVTAGTSFLLSSSASSQVNVTATVTNAAGAVSIGGPSTTSASATVQDTAIGAADAGKPVSGAGIPANSYVGTVTPGVSFLLSSSASSQVNVTATATAANLPITIGGGFPVTLPAAPADQSLVEVKKIDSGPNAVTVLCSGSDAFNRVGGGTSLQLAVAGHAGLFRYVASSAAWVVLNSDVPLTASDTRYPPTAQSQFSRAMVAETALSPAITYTDIGSSTSTLTNVRNIPAISGGVVATQPFRYNLSDVLLFASVYVVPYGPTTNVARTADVAQALTVEFDFDGQAFEVDSNCSSTNTSFRVWANEQEGATFGPTAGTGRRLVKVDFGSRAYRRVVIEFDNQSYFAGINVGGSDSVIPPSSKAPLKFAGVGDSYMFGQGYRSGTNSARSYFTTLARGLGFTNHHRYAVSGTGFVVYSGTTGLNYAARIGDVLSYQPDVVLVQGSINDSTQTAAAVTTAAANYLTALKAGLPPPSRIVVTSPLHVIASTAGDITAAAAIKAAAAAVGVPFIDATNTNWFLGTGNTTTPTGTGNADFYQSGTVANHPSPAGHIYLGQQLVREVAAALNLGE
jgi:lysophospholipase L1-like esterase